MGRFERDIDEIHRLVQELDGDVDRTTHRVEICLQRLDEIADRLAKAARLLRTETALYRLSTASGETLSSAGPGAPALPHSAQDVPIERPGSQPH